MDVKDFYFDLPEELIAQDPLEDRSVLKADGTGPGNRGEYSTGYSRILWNI